MATTPPLYTCSDATPHIVSSLFPYRRPSLDVLKVDGLKRLFGAVQQHPQVIAVDSKFPAHLILVQLFEEDGAKNSPVSLGHFIENLADPVLHLAGRHRTEDIDDRIGEVGLGIIVN